MHTIRDAAALLVLIVLALSVRVGPRPEPSLRLSPAQAAPAVESFEAPVVPAGPFMRPVAPDAEAGTEIELRKERKCAKSLFVVQVEASRKLGRTAGMVARICPLESKVKS